MDIHLLWLDATHFVVDRWHALGNAGPYYVWVASGIMGFILWAALTYRIARKLMGQRKYRGTWYSEGQYQELMQMLHEKQQAGTQVMAHEELKALRAWKFGGSGEGIFGRQKNSYFG